MEKLKNVEFYDNGGITIDRITVVFLNTAKNFYDILETYDCISCSKTGFEFFQHGNCTRGRHLGKRVNFNDLHPELQKKLINYFKN